MVVPLRNFKTSLDPTRYDKTLGKSFDAQGFAGQRSRILESGAYIRISALIMSIDCCYLAESFSES